jgi:peptide/nickel transport system substrate-binding protein
VSHRLRGSPALPALALLSLIALSACGARGRANSSYVDPYPLPADTLTFETAELGEYGGRFVLAVTSDPKTFNSLMANEQSSTDLTNLMFAGLAEIDNETQQIYPLLAKSWEVSEDGCVWTWHLRRGARFSDGHPITSADVLFMFEVAYDPVLHPSEQDLLKVKGRPFEVTAPDSYTVVMRAAGAHPLMTAIVGSLKILPRHVLEPAFRRGDFASAYSVSTPPESLVCSGAFRLRQYQPGEKVVLERNPYWLGVDSRGRRLPYLEELAFVVVPDQNAAAIKFQAGEVDAVDNVKPEDYKTYIDGAVAGNYTLHDLGPSLTTNFLWFNLNRRQTAKPGKPAGAPEVGATKFAWFSNRAFREAVSLAIDRDAIIRGPFYGEAVPNWSAPSVASRPWGGHGVPGHDYDPARANALLDSLGWRDRDRDGVREDQGGNPIRFQLRTNSDNDVRVAVANLIQDDLARIGVVCSPAPVEFNTMVANLRQDFQYDAMLMGLGSGVPADPAMYANFLTSAGVTHYWNVRQPRPSTAAEATIDRLYTTLASSIDVEERMRLWTEIVRTMNGEVFVVWLPSQKIKVPVRNSFGNVHPSVIPHRILWNIDRVFVKSASARA